MFSRCRRGFSILICLFMDMLLCTLELTSLTCIVNSIVLSISMYDLVYFLMEIFRLYVFFFLQILLVVNLVRCFVSHKNNMLYKMFILLCCVYYVLLFFNNFFVYTLFFIYYESEGGLIEVVKIIKIKTLYLNIVTYLIVIVYMDVIIIVYIYFFNIV